MDTNAKIRKRVLRLIKLGVTQKFLAGKMGVGPSTFSRWVKQTDDATWVPTVIAMDAFEAFRLELLYALRPDASTDVKREQAIEQLVAAAGTAPLHTIQEATEQFGAYLRDPSPPGDTSRSSEHMPPGSSEITHKNSGKR